MPEIASAYDRRIGMRHSPDGKYHTVTTSCGPSLKLPNKGEIKKGKISINHSLYAKYCLIKIHTIINTY